MKKILSILFVFLILISVMHITIATHHCRSADETFKRVSFTGELASCVMDGCDDKCAATENDFEEPCCDDNISVLAVDSNYAPSFTHFTAFAKQILQVYIVPVSIDFHSLTNVYLLSTSFSPPGNFLVHAVSLPKICVFQI